MKINQIVEGIESSQGVAEGSSTDFAGRPVNQELVNRQEKYWNQVAKEKKDKEKAALKAAQSDYEKTTAGKAEKYWSQKGVAEGQLDEVSLGDYRRKASLSKAVAQMGKAFGPPENREKEDRIIAKRVRGLDRADTRARANAEKLKQKAEQDRIDSLRSAKDRLADIKAELAELEAKFDSNYEYTDDHGQWTRQRELHRKIMAMKKHIADIEALDEADDNFGQPATMTRNVPKKDLKK